MRHRCAIMSASAPGCAPWRASVPMYVDRLQPPTSTKFVSNTKPAPSTTRAQHQTAAALSRAPHPDAVLRDAQRELRKLERMQVIAVEKTATWWESEHASNVRVAQDRSQLSKYLALATHPNSRPLVMNFFVPSCPGCKRMYPKFMQIAGEHPHIDFVKVNTANLQEECQLLGVERLPYFKIWAGGKVTHSFSCNLTNIADLRRALADAAPIQRPRTLFHTPSITEMPPLTGALPGGLPGVHHGGDISAQEPMHRPSGRSHSGGPPGAVRGSRSVRLPSIDDLVSGRGAHELQAASESATEGAATGPPEGGAKARSDTAP